jgi:ribosomal protein S18 acetylase RimI-like enzyme
MSQLRFRLARPEDADAIVALVESAYRGDSSRAGWTTEADLLDGQRTDRQDVAQTLAAPGTRIVLAFLEAAAETEAEAERETSSVAPAGVDRPLVDRSLVGTVLVQRDLSGTAHIAMFAIRPTLQARGLGRALLEEAERVARQDLGAPRAEMTVIEQRLDLLAWYQRRGYRPTGATEPFPYGNPRFGLPRRPDLRFVVLAKPLSGE